MSFEKLTKLVVVSILVAGFGALGCGEGEDPDPEDPDPVDTVHEDVHEVVLFDRDTDDDLGDYHEDHWHGLIELEVDHDEEDYKSVGFRFYDENEEAVDIPLGDQGYDYDIEVDDGDLVWIDEHSDHFHIGGRDHEGETAIYFDFTHDGDVFFDTHHQGLSVFVDDHDHDNNHNHDDGELEVEEFALLDRAHEPHQEIAHLHGDHWDGDFEDGIELTVADDPEDYDTAAAGEGEAVSLGADVEEMHDDHTHSVDLDGSPYELDVAPAHDGDGDYVELHSHGDHVHVIGVAEGHAHVVFQIVDRPHEEVVWESPEFEFDVHDH